MLVTGAASGIGAATALLAAERGVSLLLLDRDSERLAAVAEAARHAGAGPVFSASMDVTDAEQLETGVQAGCESVGVPTAAVCCAGVDRGGSTHLATDADFDFVVDINLRGTFMTCRSFARRLIDESLTGSAVCISSIAASVGLPAGTAAYSASKGGVSAMVRSLAVEYGASGIRFNAIAPGATETPLMWANVADADRAEVRRRVCDVVPLGRLAQPRELAYAALWLLSAEAAYVTGSELVVDGGILATSVLPA